MKKILLTIATMIAVLAPVSADASPQHHGHVSSRAIDWD